MKLRKLLSDCTPPKLVNMIHAWDGKIPKSASINELIDQLSESILNPIKLEKALKSLMQSDRTLLGIALMCDGHLDFARLSEITKENELRYNISFYISHLESSGLFFVKYGKNANITVPEDLISPLKKLLLKNTPVIPMDEENLIIKNASPIIDDIFRICIFSMNKGGIRLTQDGELFKKARQELLDMLGTENEDRLDYAIDIMTASNLLISNEKMLNTVDENAQLFFSNSKKRITIDLISSINKMYRLKKSLASNFLSFLSMNCDEDWIDLKNYIKLQKNDYFEKKEIQSWLEFEDNQLEQLINSLYFIGILDIKYFGFDHYEQMHSFKVSQFGKHVIEINTENRDTVEMLDKSFILSPNFEVNVFSKEPDYYTMYRLGKIAKMLRFDTACTFKLEKEFVMRELTNGTKLEEIISFLTQHSKKELPQNVNYSILDWGSKFGKVTAGKGYIEIIDQSMYERVEQILSPYIIRSIKNPVIIFDERKEKEVLLRLRKADIFPSEFKKINAEKKTYEDQEEEEYY
jgi:hypothetical protein